MSTGTSAPSQDKETVTKKGLELASALAVVAGAAVLLAGSIVLFAASPTTPVGPIFGLSSLEPVSVIANMILGASIGATGVSVVIPRLDDLLQA